MKKGSVMLPQSGALAANLMLAPAVVAMRMPLLMAETLAVNPWRVETVRAVSEKAGAMAEGMVAAQMSLFWSASRFWIDIYRGTMPSQSSAGVAIENAMKAGLRPSGRRVKSYYNRLKRSR